MVCKNKIKVAAIQMNSGSCVQTNLSIAADLIEAACKQGAELTVLPENFALMPVKERDKLNYVEQHGKGQVQDFLAEQAKKQAIWLIGGTHPIESDTPQKPYARSYVFSPDGNCHCWYDKIHLFDVAVDTGAGQQQYQESRYLQAGDKVGTFVSPWGKVGLSICYDLRFPELYRKLALDGARILAVPAAFTEVTGRAHWKVLLKARAIENQCYIIAAAQVGEHSNGRKTWGHSSIISPWGEVIAEQTSDEGLIVASINLAEQEKLRNEFPVLKHTRL